VENFVVEKINDWLQNKEKLPRFGEMQQYIEKSATLSKMNQLLSKDDRYKKSGKRATIICTIIFYYLMLNDKELHLGGRVAELSKLEEVLTDIFILYAIYMFTIKPCFITSSDYIDSLEASLEPVEGSQYFVSPFVQEIFDDIINIRRPDLAQELRSTTFIQLL
jgi:hypothetical protein